MTSIPSEATRRARLPIPSRRTLEIGIPLAILVLAAALRLIGLGHPHELVFDETYYVKDAWTLANHGFETAWPEDANTAFNAGDPNGFRDDASYVVHPPLGKWIIAVGMLLLGADNPWGWRITTAIMGIALVGITYLFARRLVDSPVWAGIAALFVAVDGVAIVLSRVSLLDTHLAVFTLLGAYFVLRDRQAMSSAYPGPSPDEPTGAPPRGVVFWRRPWVFAAGVAFGAACSVKWSGLYVLAGFGIYLVVTDALARRRAGEEFWPTTAVLRQGPVTFLLLVPVALLAYLSSWIGWFVTAGGWKRDSDPNPLIALWNYHQEMYGFHVGLTSGHSYASPAWQWPLLLRPTSMYWHSADCGPADATYTCVQAITPIANPMVWWGGMIAILYLLYRFAFRPDWRYALVLTGVAVTYLPWLLYPERTIFQFYTVAMVPFVAIAGMLALHQLVGNRLEHLRGLESERLAFLAADAAWVAEHGTEGAPRAERQRPLILDHPFDESRALRVAHRWVAGVVVAVVLLSAFFLPVWTGMEIPHWFWQLHMWLPSWI